MPGYSPYSVSAQLLQKHKFCTLDEFQSFINIYEYSSSLYICKFSRNITRQEFASLRKGAPFSKTVRFPDSFCIDMDCAKIRTVTKQFLNALFLLDLWEQEGVVCTSTNRIEFINNVTDAKKPYDEAFTKFADIIMSTDIKHLEENGFYSRETFEEKCGLTWYP